MIFLIRRNLSDFEEWYHLFTADEQVNIPANIVLRRGIHVLVELFNNAMSSQILIKQSSLSNIPFFLKIFFVVLLIQSVVGLLGLYGFASEFHQITANCLSVLYYQIDTLFT